jgi:hypothetical protein
VAQVKLTVAGLQADLFDQFNAEGSTVTVLDPGDPPFPLGLVDTWELLRVAPHAGASGSAELWVVWREPGFLGLPPPDGNWQGTMQYVHVSHFVRFEKTPDYLLLTDGDRTVLKVDFLDDAERARWDAFRVQKAKYSDLYDRYYKESADEIIEDANSL